LKHHYEDISEIYVLDSMPHTSAIDSIERRKIFEKWFLEQINM
jgi:hypothetical protein